MQRMKRIFLASASIFGMLVIVDLAQVPQGGRGGAPQGPPLMQTPPKPLIANAKPVRTCESLASVALPNTTIESAAVDADNAGICRVVAVATHPPAGDKVRIWIAIPTSKWNGRFLGTGGGGFSGGSATGVNRPVALGFAAGATRHRAHRRQRVVCARRQRQARLAGHPQFRTRRHPRDDGYRQGADAGDVRRAAALLVLQRLLDRRTPGADGGAALSAGLQRHRCCGAGDQLDQPDDAVALGRDADEHGVEPDSRVQACRGNGGGGDGLRRHRRREGRRDRRSEDAARYDPKALIGTSAGECEAFTQADADIIRKLWEGPRRADGGPLWYGPARGADLNPLAASRGTPLTPQAFGFSVDWLRYFITQDPQFDWTTVTPAAYQAFWDRSPRAVRHRHRHRQSGPHCVPRSRRQDDHLARLGRSTHYRGRHDRLLQARAAADGRREEDVGVRATLSRARRRPLRRRPGAAAGGRARRARVVGRRRQGARDADRRAARSKLALSRARVRSANTLWSRSTRARAVRTTREALSAARGSNARIGGYLGYVRLVGRRRLETRLAEPIVSIPSVYGKALLLRSSE